MAGSTGFLPADSQRGTHGSGNPVWFGYSSASLVPDDASESLATAELRH